MLNTKYNWSWPWSLRFCLPPWRCRCLPCSQQPRCWWKHQRGCRRCAPSNPRSRSSLSPLEHNANTCLLIFSVSYKNTTNFVCQILTRCLLTIWVASFFPMSFPANLAKASLIGANKVKGPSEGKDSFWWINVLVLVLVWVLVFVSVMAIVCAFHILKHHRSPQFPSGRLLQQPSWVQRNGGQASNSAK